MNSKISSLLSLLFIPTMASANILFGRFLQVEPYSLFGILFIAVSLIINFLLMYFLIERNWSKVALATLAMNAASSVVGYILFSVVPKGILFFIYAMFAFLLVKLGVSPNSWVLSVLALIPATIVICAIVLLINTIIQTVVGLLFFPKSRLKSLIKVVVIANAAVFGLIIVSLLIDVVYVNYQMKYAPGYIESQY